MTDASQMQRWGLTPVKATVIALLAIVLLVVIAVQWSDRIGFTSATPPRMSDEGKEVAKRSTDMTRSTVASTVKTAQQRKPWPSISVDEIIQYDPLLVPEALAEHRSNAANQPPTTMVERTEVDEQAEMARRRESARKAIQQLGVRVVISGKRGAVATIGSRTVRVGDVIDGFVIEDIRTDGVILADPTRLRSQPNSN